MSAALFLRSPTSWGADSAQVVGRAVRLGVGRGVGSGVGAGSGVGVGRGVGAGSTVLESRVGVALGICSATVGTGESATHDEMGAAAPAENDDGGDWPWAGVALVTPAGVPNASPSSPAGRPRPPIVNANTDTARTTVPTAALTIGARQALRSLFEAPPLSPKSPPGAGALIAAAAATASAAPADMPHPGHPPAA